MIYFTWEVPVLEIDGVIMSSVNGSMQLFEEFWNNSDLEHQSCWDGRSLRKELFWKYWKHKEHVTSSRSLFQIFVLLNSVQKKVKDSIKKKIQNIIYIYILEALITNAAFAESIPLVLKLGKKVGIIYILLKRDINFKLIPASLLKSRYHQNLEWRYY